MLAGILLGVCIKQKNRLSCMKQKSAAFQALCRRSNSKMIKPMVKMIIVNEDKRDDQNNDNRMIDKTLIEINSLGLLLSEK